jgi:hypothetical protein
MSGIHNPISPHRLAYEDAYFRSGEKMKVTCISYHLMRITLQNEKYRDVWQIHKDANISNWHLNDIIEIKIGTDFYEYPATLVNTSRKNAAAIAHLQPMKGQFNT